MDHEIKASVTCSGFNIPSNPPQGEVVISFNNQTTTIIGTEAFFLSKQFEHGLITSSQYDSAIHQLVVRNSTQNPQKEKNQKIVASPTTKATPKPPPVIAPSFLALFSLRSSESNGKFVFRPDWWKKESIPTITVLQNDTLQTLTVFKYDPETASMTEEGRVNFSALSNQPSGRIKMESVAIHGSSTLCAVTFMEASLGAPNHGDLILWNWKTNQQFSHFDPKRVAVKDVVFTIKGLHIDIENDDNGGYMSGDECNSTWRLLTEEQLFTPIGNFKAANQLPVCEPQNYYGEFLDDENLSNAYNQNGFHKAIQSYDRSLVLNNYAKALNRKDLIELKEQKDSAPFTSIAWIPKYQRLISIQKPSYGPQLPFTGIWKIEGSKTVFEEKFNCEEAVKVFPCFTDASVIVLTSNNDLVKISFQNGTQKETARIKIPWKESWNECNDTVSIALDDRIMSCSFPRGAVWTKDLVLEMDDLSASAGLSRIYGHTSLQTICRWYPESKTPREKVYSLNEQLFHFGVEVGKGDLIVAGKERVRRVTNHTSLWDVTIPINSSLDGILGLYSVKGKQAVAVHVDGSLYVYKVADGSLLKKIEVPHVECCCCFQLGQKDVFAFAVDGTVKILPLEF